MKTKTLLLLISILFASNAFSQNHDHNHGLGPQNVRHGLGSQNVRSTQQNNGTTIHDSTFKVQPKTIKSEIKSSKDSVFYLNVTKRNGWPEGIGKPLKREELSHIPVYFVLSNRNEAGKWTFMRAYNAYGNLTTNHSWGAYIMNQNDEYDTGANADWVEKLKTVCQWEYIGDSEGKEVIQERALDKDKNVVFCYNIVKVKENKKDGSSIYSGSYTDAFALPIFMRTDSTGNYKDQANFVQVKRDKRGYETLFAFTDETGRIRLNKDGAYQTSKEYDDNGVQIREASLDLAGNQMIDSYGNCGWINVVDEYGNHTKAVYFGKDNEPIQMPGTRGSNKVFGYEFTYDKYHREQDRWYLDSLGNRDVNEYDVYHTVFEYNNHGERSLLSHYDRQGNLIGSDEYGIAQVVADYDDKGNLLFLEWRNKDGLPINGYGDYCRRVLTYDENGNLLSQFDYIKDDNDSITVSFKYLNDGLGNEIRYWYTDGYYRVDSVDVKGRATLEAWYDLNNKPIGRPTDEIQAWHKNVTTYDDENNIELEEWLDTDGDPYVNTENSLSNKYNFSINAKNLTNNILTNTQYLKPIGLAQKFQKEFDDDGNIIAQWDITPYGEQARVGWWNNLHYKCKVNYTMYGKMMDMIGVNEFDEPSYLVSLNDNGEVYHYFDMGTYYDEHMQVIPTDSMTSFKEKLPKVFCIEVTDTTIAYPLGLKNGDIILSYGDWATSEDLRSNLDYFYLETILKNSISKKIIVLRHDINDKKSSIFVHNLPVGKPSELGFYPHQICYTQKEASRLRDACHRYNFTYGSDVVNGSKQILMGVQLKGGLVQTRFYHFDSYDYKDPGFLLYASKRYSKDHDTWSVMYDDIITWRKRDMYNSKYSSVDIELYLTQDMKSLKKLSKSGKGNRGLRIIPIYVTDEVYANLLSYYNTIDELPKQTITSEENAISTIKEKQVVGKWNTVIENDEGSVDLTLNLDKKNHAKMVMSLGLGGEISDGITLKIKASVTNSGSWSLQGNELCLDMNDESCQMNLDGIEIEGADDSLRKKIMEQVAGRESELLELLASNVSKSILRNSIDIVSISKTELTTKIENDTISFKKIN